jgi:two-component system chemotaxis response regulator CheB
LNGAEPPVRVLICEDSATYARALARALERDAAFEVVGVSRSAEEALKSMRRTRPDVVTMDLGLPGMSGLEAVERIMGVLPVPIVVLSGQLGPSTQAAAAALAAGALDAIPKDDLDLAHPDGASAAALRRRLKVASAARVIRHPRAALNGAHVAPAGRRAAVIGLCASTGGPRALAQVLAGLPGDFRIPIFAVQHMSPGFLEGLVRWLDDSVPLPVGLARPGRALPGVWIAPEGAHLVVGRTGRLALDRTSDPGRHRPSGDVLLASLAAFAGADAVAVVLTGMGSDGAEGLRAVREAGGLGVAQDRETSAVYGMPRAAAEAGAELVVPLGQVAGILRGLEPVEVGR